MAKFIELHADGSAFLLNLDTVQAIGLGRESQAVIATNDGGTQDVDESYAEIRTMIGAAQGGIPMEPGRMY